MDIHLVAAGKIKTLFKVDSGSEVASQPSDAFCISAAGLGALGIASGTPGIQPDGYSGAPYTATLMSNCTTAFATANAPKPGNLSAKTHSIDPAYILAHAQQATCQPGTAAVALAALQPGNKLCITNLGDCRMLLLRDGEVWQETEEQVHSEVFAGVRKPYQMGHPSFATGSDNIHDSARYLWDVQEGDIIVAGTSTFFSHVKRSNITQITLKTLAGAATPLNPTPSSGLKRVASAVRRHTSGGGALDPGAAQPVPAAAAAAAAISPNSSSNSSPNVSRGSSPEPVLDDIAAAAAHAADVLATAAAKRLAQKKTKAAAAAAAAEAAAAAASTGSNKGSFFARLKKQPKPPAKQPLPCTLKDDIACVVAVATSKGCSTTSGSTTTAAAADLGVTITTEDSPHTTAVTSRGINASSTDTAGDPETPHYTANPFAAPGTAAVALLSSTAADNVSTDSCRSSGHGQGRPPSEAGSTSKLFSSPSIKDPWCSKTEFKTSPASSDHIRVYRSASVLKAGTSKNQILPNWFGPELGDSPSKLELTQRRSAAAKLLSAAAEQQSAVGSSRSESPTGSYAGRQMLRMRSMQNSFYSNQSGGESHHRSSHRADCLPPTQHQYEQYRSRRATVGGSSSSSSSYRTSSNKSDGGASYSSHMQGYSSSSRRSEVLSSRSSSSSNLTALKGLPPTPASARSAASRVSKGSTLPDRPASRPAAALVDPATAVPAGMDRQGQQLYVGCQVLVESEAGVAAVGTVKLVTGQQLNKWEPEKVSPGHVGVGDICIESSMVPAARLTRFWVKCEAFKLYGNHPDFTFWTRKTALESGINVSIPCSCLRLVE